MAIAALFAYGEMTMSIRNELLEQILASIQGGATESLAYIILESTTTQALSTDEANPTVLDNWVVLASNLLSLDNDGIKNESGRDIPALHGTIGIHPQVDGGGGSRLISLTSERSPDGITYTINDQYRPIYTNNVAETYNTKESYLVNFLDEERIRFIAYADTAMSVAPSSAQFRGQTVTGPAMLWVIHEI